MDDRSYETALRRARKAFAHSTRQLAEAQSERAAKRHARRIRNARARQRDAQWSFDRIAWAMEGGEA